MDLFMIVQECEGCDALVKTELLDYNKRYYCPRCMEELKAILEENKYESSK